MGVRGKGGRGLIDGVIAKRHKLAWSFFPPPSICSSGLHMERDRQRREEAGRRAEAEQRRAISITTIYKK